MKKLNFEEIKCAYENGEYIKDIAKRYNSVYSTISNFLKKHGFIIKRRYTGNRCKSVDLNFFENIDNNIKAYILGLLCSDGSIDKNGYGFQITSKDFEILDNVKNILNSEHKICKVEAFDKRTHKIYTRYNLHICSKKMVDDLKKLGLSNNKSFDCKMPAIDKIYFWDFLRGLFDGDGCITGKYGKLRISFIATEDIINNIKIIFNENGLSNNKLTIQSENEVGKIYNLKQNSYKDILFIRENMYKSLNVDNPYCLIRKYNKLQELQEYKLGELSHKNKIWKKVLFKDDDREIIYSSIKECCYEQHLILKSVYEAIRKNTKHKGYIINYL